MLLFCLLSGIILHPRQKVTPTETHQTTAGTKTMASVMLPQTGSPPEKNV